METKGSRTVESVHKELGRIMWDNCGMSRNKAGLTAAISKIQKLREEFENNIRIPGEAKGVNTELEKAGRVADYIELGELMCRDALSREESCGGHFRDEHQENGEAKRDDDNFAYVAAWEYKGEPRDAVLHKEPLVFDSVKLVQRSYK